LGRAEAGREGKEGRDGPGARVVPLCCRFWIAGGRRRDPLGESALGGWGAPCSDGRACSAKGDRHFEKIAFQVQFVILP
jgi:hypothetical protein